MVDKEYGGVEVKLALLQAAIDRMACDMAEVKMDVKALKTDYYVTWSEFKPVRTLVYGAVTLILIEFFTALVYLVLRS